MQLSFWVLQTFGGEKADLPKSSVSRPLAYSAWHGHSARVGTVHLGQGLSLESQMEHQEQLGIFLDADLCNAPGDADPLTLCILVGIHSSQTCGYHHKTGSMSSDVTKE